MLDVLPNIAAMHLLSQYLIMMTILFACTQAKIRLTYMERLLQQAAVSVQGATQTPPAARDQQAAQHAAQVDTL